MPSAGLLPASVDVMIVGAGPVGLTLANILGLSGVSTCLIEERSELIDYPRGVGMDDECLRVFQAIGLADAVTPHTTPNQWMRFLSARGRVFASVEPRTDEFGWPRRNAFIQPLVDRVLADGTNRFECVSVRFGTAFAGYEPDADGITVQVSEAGGRPATVRARYLVGADGGRSAVRKAAGISFDGKTESTRWLVVDLADDPVGTPNAVLFCNPERPAVSIALPHGIRRFEFLVFPHETEEGISASASLRSLLGRVTVKPDEVRIVRTRVYTHHARLASQFRSGRVLLAGDAAHLMPVWQGQGYNSGIRDAGNLGWKLALVAKRLAGDALLDTYEAERREHARAMIALSVMAGRIFSPTRAWQAALRDGTMRVLELFPPAKRYVTQMRFKPMPRYENGVVLLEAGGKARKGRVGSMFPQPIIRTAAGESRKLDDVLGPDFAILAWGDDPRRYMSAEALSAWTSLGARFLTAVPETQLALASRRIPDATVIGDPSGRLKDWFGDAARSVAFIRPDRFLAALCGPQETTDVTLALLARLHHRTAPSPRDEAHADPPAMPLPLAPPGRERAEARRRA